MNDVTIDDWPEPDELAPEYVARVNGEGEPDERVYQRLKRRRSRTVNRLRDLLEGALGPRSEACAL
jgi:hypothetical protein